MIHTEFGCTVSRFVELVGVPRRTYHARLARRGLLQPVRYQAERRHRLGGGMQR